MRPDEGRYSRRHRSTPRAIGIALSVLALAGSPGTAQREGQPGIPFSGAKPDADMQAVLDAHAALGARPVETLSPVDARLQPGIADAVKAVQRRIAGSADPLPGPTTRDLVYPTPAGPMTARVYAPADAAGRTPPVILYFHGGGFVIADINGYDATPRALVRETNAIVVSAEYHRAPEFKFPTQQDDALAAYRWVLAKAASFGGDPKRVALAGESAGGNLAVNVAIAARDAGLPAPLHQLLVYPVAASDMNTRSKRESANAKPLNRAALMWFYHHAGRTTADANDPRLNLVAANLGKLPNTTIVLAQIDLLRDDGEMLGEAIRRAGGQAVVKTFGGVTHEFFGTDAVVKTAGEAQRFAGERLRAAFGVR